MFHADGQTDRRTDMTKLKVAVRNFANVPKNGLKLYTSAVRSIVPLHIKAQVVAKEVNDKQRKFTHRTVASLSHTINTRVW